MMASKGVCNGPLEVDLDASCWGVVRSVREVDDRRSVISEVAVVGALDAWS